MKPALTKVFAISAEPDFPSLARARLNGASLLQIRRGGYAFRLEGDRMLPA
jgi:hypothetical protein